MFSTKPISVKDSAIKHDETIKIPPIWANLTLGKYCTSNKVYDPNILNHSLNKEISLIHGKTVVGSVILKKDSNGNIYGEGKITEEHFIREHVNYVFHIQPRDVPTEPVTSMDFYANPILD